MGVRRTLLHGPAFAAISRGYNATVGADRPTTRGIVARKRDREEVIFGRGANLSPFFSAIPGSEYDAPRTNCECMLPILNVESVERSIHTRMLAFPLKAAVRRVKDHRISANCPAVPLV